MAKEYIERETTLRNLADDLPYKGSVKRVIMQAPAADVVEVVRCGQCKHWKINPNNLYGGYCRYCEGAKIDHFCSYGERRQG